MEKRIEIIVTQEEASDLKIEGMNPFEALGLLRFWEKTLYLDTHKNSTIKEVTKNKNKNETI